MPQDRITLSVPARGEYARTVRMTASALVSRMGMSFDGVDDVRMAAEEAFVYAVDTLPEDAEVIFSFIVDDDALEIDVTLGGEPDVSDDEVERRTTYATFILQSVCDSYDLVSDANGRRSLRLYKRAENADAV
ncbi:MAG TPA: ATP-binding protein [Coriobacteriia bacterium]|nr:ATP-binding protein [Coriobacteriia bacterium]